MTLSLTAPLAGWVGPLAELPDAAFAEGLVGDGVAIDPTGTTLHAPCAGIVAGLHRARHAVTIRADNGADILCHVGIETVGLGGNGFEALVAEGDRVKAGTPLLAFDLDVLAGGARSLASPILVIDGEAFRVSRRAANKRIAVGEWLMDVEAIGAATTVAALEPRATALTREVALPPGHGIHARPAAAIVARMRGFAASVEIATDRASAPATSAVALMTLGAAGGDRLTLRASGDDAESALAALAELIEHGPEDGPAAEPPAPPPPPSRVGVTAVPGVAVGTVVRLDSLRRDPPATGSGVEAETRALADALAAVRATLGRQAATELPAQRAIADAHLALLDDPRLHAAAAAAIEDGASAGAAWRAALAPDIAALRAVADARIASRADDLVDLEQQVIAATLGPAEAAIAIPPDAILVAHDLLPSELMALDALAGIALAAGGPTSHVAIIAAARGVPMAVAMGEAALALPAGARAILDADAATLVEADAEAERDVRTRIAAAGARRAAAQAVAQTECHMADGTRIEVFANLGSLADADAAMAAGAEGCGLLRTELLFLDRDEAPDEAEQRALYAAIAQRLDGRPVIVRTLDIGGDKPVRYLPIGPEENPALGLRGIRVGLARPDLLDAQLRAILSAAPPGQCRILVPMIASLDELIEVRRRAEAAAISLGIGGAVSLGVMIETPAAAIAADLLAPAADFFAIGTNDLSQYTLAMDRGNPAVAPQVDAMHPAVLRLIGAAAQAGAAHGRPVGVCGGLASDLTAAAILIGLGVTELSAVPGVIPELKAHVRTLTFAGCEALATAALDRPSAAAVRALAGKGIG